MAHLLHICYTQTFSAIKDMFCMTEYPDQNYSNQKEDEDSPQFSAKPNLDYLKEFEEIFYKLARRL